MTKSRRDNELLRLAADANLLGSDTLSLRMRIRNGETITEALENQSWNEDQIADLMRQIGIVVNDRPKFDKEETSKITSPEMAVIVASNGSKSLATCNPTSAATEEMADRLKLGVQYVKRSQLNAARSGEEPQGASHEMPSPQNQSAAAPTVGRLSGLRGQRQQRRTIGSILAGPEMGNVIDASQAHLVDAEIRKLVTEEQYHQALAKLSDKEFVDPEITPPTAEAIRLLNRATITQHRVFPLRVEDDALVVLMSDPRSVSMQKSIQGAVRNKTVVPAVATPSAIAKLISSNVERDKAVESLKREANARRATEQLSAPTIDANADNAVVKIVDQIIREGIDQGVSDIHIETKDAGVIVRYRIDGKLREGIEPLPASMARNIVARIKTLGEMDSTITRQPLDGRLKFRHNNGDIEFRVSTIPITTGRTKGEKVVMRQLARGSVPALNKLGLSEANYRRLVSMAQQPNGIILVSGPTGSGKTTTCNSMLAMIATPDKNITSIEDPIEYEIPAINQTQVDRAQELDFAKALKSFLRQDPDIIFIGEIRDQETAEIAVSAANTGHLVIATIHTNDAPEVVTRLLQMGTESWQLSSALIGAVAQRLVRRLCPHCRETKPITAQAAKRLNLPLEEAPGKPLMVWTANPNGCPRCNDGYKGRLGIHEIAYATDSFREAIAERLPSTELRKLAIQQGMVSMRDDGILKAERGETTIYEVLEQTRDESGEDPIADAKASLAEGEE